MTENGNASAVVVPKSTNESNDETSTPAPASAPTNDGKLLLTVIKYDSGMAKLLPGGKLAPTPSQLGTSRLGIIRAQLLNDAYLEKADGNKPFCTKDGIEVTDDITFDHYIQENSNGNTENDLNANAESQNQKVKRHNIYILTKARETKELAPSVATFMGKPLDLSNTAKVDLLTASTGAPLTSSFSDTKWTAAEADGSIVHPADMTEKEWGIVMRNNNLLSGQFLQTGSVEKIIKVPGQEEITRPGIDVTNVEKSYYSAFALKPRKLPDYNITFTITEKTEQQMSDLKIELPDHLFRIPRFHTKDASQVRVFETKGSLETTMANSSFTEDSVHAAVAGSAFGWSGAAKGGADWSEDNKTASSRFNDTNYMHVVYEFPRVELILNEETLQLSDECREDIYNLRHRRSLDELHHFENRYGVFFTRSVHLGGKLVSIDESDSVAGASASEKTNMLKAAASASVAGYGFQAEVNYSHTKNTGGKETSTEKKMTHSMSWSAQGGETTLCNNPPKWCPTVTSFYNWRVMKQANVINIYELIGKLPGYEDIPTLVENILHINTDPKNMVKFSLELPPHHKHGHRRLHFGQPEEKAIAQSHMDRALADPHSLLPHVKEFTSDVALKPMTEQYRPYGTKFGIPMSKGQANIWLGKSLKVKDKDTIFPRLEYGVKYPVQYEVEERPAEKKEEGSAKKTEEETAEKTSSLFTLQVGGDKSSNRFLYGEHDKAANVMVEFLGKKNTPVLDYTQVTLQFSYVLQGATIPNVSNFRFKDIMEKPDMEELKQRIIKGLPEDLEEPQEPERPDITLWESRTFGPQVWLYGIKFRNYATMDSSQKTPEVERHKKIYDKKMADYDHEMKTYEEKRRKHEQEVKRRLKVVAQRTNKECSTLQKEWDDHQKIMNEFVPFKELVFKMNYCDEENKKNIVTVRGAEATALKAAKKAKDDKIAKELSRTTDAEKKAAKEAAMLKDHAEKLEKRIQNVLIWMDYPFKWAEPSWVAYKPKLERIQHLLDPAKAKLLEEDIKKKDDAITRLAEFDLELPDSVAAYTMRNSPFYKAASVEVKIPK